MDRPAYQSYQPRRPHGYSRLDHMGILGHTVDDGIAPWIDTTVAMAKYPNIYVKVSAVPGYSKLPFPHPGLNKYVEKIVRAFGPERCFWGTDLTRMLERNKLSYTQCVEHFTKHMPFMSERDKEWVMGRAICECLNWPIK